MKVEAKICGLGWPEDARRAAQAGADYLGVVFAPSPRRRVSEEARRIWEGTAARRVGVFVDPDREEAVELAVELAMAVVQLHGSEAPGFCQRIREAGDWAVWKALRVREGVDPTAAVEKYAEAVDGILLEGWSARGLGGVGARFDWSRVGRLREDWPPGVRLILAGGLNAGNVEGAIESVAPDVVDVSSGVELSPGVKDPAAVSAFLEAVKRASGDG
jgi:phosphoribosylanthranilate isomerase